MSEQTAEVETPVEVKSTKTPTTVIQNGVPRPNSGATAKVWEIADRISEESKTPAKRAAVLAEGEAAGLHPSTVATQFGRWCRFHGLKLSELKATPEATEKAPKTKKAKAAPEAEEAPEAE